MRRSLLRSSAPPRREKNDDGAGGSVVVLLFFPRREHRVLQLPRFPVSLERARHQPLLLVERGAADTNIWSYHSVPPAEEVVDGTRLDDRNADAGAAPLPLDGMFILSHPSHMEHLGLLLHNSSFGVPSKTKYSGV